MNIGLFLSSNSQCTPQMDRTGFQKWNLIMATTGWSSGSQWDPLFPSAISHPHSP